MHRYKPGYPEETIEKIRKINSALLNLLEPEGNLNEKNRSYIEKLYTKRNEFLVELLDWKNSPAAEVILNENVKEWNEEAENLIMDDEKLLSLLKEKIDSVKSELIDLRKSVSVLVYKKGESK